MKRIILLSIVLIVLVAGCIPKATGNAEDAPIDGQTYDYEYVIGHSSTHVTHYIPQGTNHHYYQDKAYKISVFLAGYIDLDHYFEFDNLNVYKYHASTKSISGTWDAEPIKGGKE